ncbi:MAG: FAD binding domain-containing protein [Chloroflexi bacterium]|nr:FAD binding domain-containing protein [Chloroflexota bacterium]
MNPFDFQSPSTVGEAAALLTQQARPIAGGTDLLAEIKNGVVAPDLLVNLLNIAELQGITELADGLRIGATTRIEDLLEWPGLWQNYSLLAQSCQVLAWSEIRAMGTVGGNLCQRPRCWYYRHPLGTRCLKRGGDHCYPTQGRANGPFAIFGGGPCYAVHPSDLAVALAAMRMMWRAKTPCRQASCWSGLMCRARNSARGLFTSRANSAPLTTSRAPASRSRRGQTITVCTMRGWCWAAWRPCRGGRQRSSRC